MLYRQTSTLTHTLTHMKCLHNRCMRFTFHHVCSVCQNTCINQKMKSFIVSKMHIMDSQLDGKNELKCTVPSCLADFARMRCAFCCATYPRHVANNFCATLACLTSVDRKCQNCLFIRYYSQLATKFRLRKTLIPSDGQMCIVIEMIFALWTSHTYILSEFVLLSR